MPIENERKYVLCLDASVEKKLKRLATKKEVIDQTYLFSTKKQSLRVRMSKSHTGTVHIMTYKFDIGKKCVEINTEISARDYKMLCKSGKMTLHKVRYHVNGWEIDCFKSSDKTYFIQAEIEMEENQKKPDKMPELVTENLIHVVKQGDGRFASKRLSDVRYAKKLLQKLLIGRS